MSPLEASAHELDTTEASAGASGLLKMARRFYRRDADARELAEAVAAALGSSKGPTASIGRAPLAIMHAIVHERINRRSA